MNKSLFVLAVLVLLTSGCAWTPQSAVLKPQLQSPLTSTGQGRPVLLTVVDERPRTTLGTRAITGVGAEISVQGDLTQIVKAAVTEGLQRQGFVVTPDKPADARELRVEIRNLDYGVTAGIAYGTLRTECGLKGICIIGSTRPYERLYRGEHRETVLLVQTAEANEKYLNTALSEAINALLRDSQVTQTLTQ
jgi:uncharacterized lipoprotein